ncbi:hypothetical protein D3C73_19180 [compost metagenome]
MPRKNGTPKHIPFRFASNCQTKRRFRSEKEALSAADHQMLTQSNLTLNIYKCELCGGWHLTRTQR